MSSPKRDRVRRALFTRRAAVMALGQVGLLGALGGRLWQLQVVEAEKYATLAEENRILVRLLPPPRGRILDRNGVLIARNRLNWRALLIAEKTDNVAATLATFSQIVPLSEGETGRIEREVRKRRRFVPVQVRDFLDWEDMARLEVNAPDLPGIVVDAGQSRIYPNGEVLAHVVGYVAAPSEKDLDGDPLLELPGVRIGRAGIERIHDHALRGRAGRVQLEVNAVGRVIRELSRKEGTPGADIGLTIDAELQKFAMERIADEAAAAVVIDPRNGEVLAMASTPSFDPSLFNAGVGQTQWKEWMTNTRTPLNNKAVSGLYAPGSTFKMVVGLAALEAGTLRPGDQVFCPGYVNLGEYRFHCWKKGGHGTLGLNAALGRSCDVFFYEVAKRTGIDRIAAMAQRFGLATKLPIDLPGAKTGLMPTRAWKLATIGSPWAQGETLVHGIGQGFIQVSPLQLAVMTARLATGRAVDPHLTRSVDGKLLPGHQADAWPSLGINEAHLRLVREGMYTVVNDRGGTAYASRLLVETMAGKTGTTQVRRISRAERLRGVRKQEDVPYEHRHHALFVSYAPYANPRYACCVVIEHGGGGSAVAAPVARDILNTAFEREKLGSQRIAEVAAPAPDARSP